MSDLAEKISETVQGAESGHLNTAIALLVAITATFIAICNVKDGNIVQAMAQDQARAVDSWSYFQAKSTKMAIAEGALDQLVIQKDVAGATLAPDVRDRLDKKITQYSDKIHQYDREKNEIKQQAEAFEKDYDALNVHDDQFDMAEALMSISLAVFGITALTRKRSMLFVATALAGVGVVLGLAGFLGLNLHPQFLARLLG